MWVAYILAAKSTSGIRRLDTIHATLTQEPHTIKSTQLQR